MQLKLTPTLRSLSLESQVIAIESLSIHMPNKALLTKLSNLTSGVSQFISEKTAALFNRGDIPMVGLSGGFTRHLKGANYVELKDVMLPCPEGLRISFLNYIDIIEDAQKITSHVLEDCLYPFSVFISEALNRPEKLTSATRVSNVKLHNLDQVRKKLTAAFDGVHAEIPYGKALARNADWDEIEKRLNRVIDTQKRTSNKLIADKVDEIDASLSKLIANIQDTNQQYRPSTEIVAELSKLSYGLAEQITFYSIISTSVEALLVSVEEAKKVLKAAVKK